MRCTILKSFHLQCMHHDNENQNLRKVIKFRVKGHRVQIVYAESWIKIDALFSKYKMNFQMCLEIFNMLIKL